MRKFLFFCFLMAGAIALDAQSYNICQHAGMDNTGNAVAINSKTYYFSTNQTACCAMQTVVYGRNNQAQTIFTVAINHPGESWDYPQELTKTADGALLLFGYAMAGCDVGGVRNYIVKIDTTGNVLFHTYVLNSLSNTWLPACAVAHPDSSFYAAAFDSLCHYSKTGQLVSKTKIGIGMYSINSMVLLANGNFLVNGIVNNALKNVELSVSATVINQQAGSSTITKLVRTASGKLAGRTSASNLEIYTPSMMLVASTTTAGLPGPVTDFVTRNDSLFVTGFTPTYPFYAVLSPSLTILYQTQAAYKAIKPTGIAINNKNNVGIISTCGSAGLGVTFKGYYQMPLTGSFVSTADVGVTSMSLSSLSFSTTSTGPGNPFPVYPQYNLHITVKNYSATDTVHNFCLNSLINQPYCVSLFHKEYFFTIPPQGTVSVLTGTIYGLQLIVPANTTTSGVFYEPICFFTTVPNQTNDIDISNDGACDSIMITGIGLGIADNNMLAARVDVFPNPFSNQLIINSDVEIQHLSICNVLGAQVYESRETAKSLKLEQPALPAGVYMMKLQTEKGELIKKVVKQ